MPKGAGATEERKSKAPSVDPKITADLQGRVLYRDSDVLVMDKPAGLAVQGGTGQAKHLDGYLDALRFDADERPRLVHRLTRIPVAYSCGARNATAARWLTEAFRQRDTRKAALAVVIRCSQTGKGIIDAPLDKRHAGAGERMELVDPAKAGGDDGLPDAHLGRAGHFLAGHGAVDRPHASTPGSMLLMP